MMQLITTHESCQKVLLCCSFVLYPPWCKCALRSFHKLWNNIRLIGEGWVCLWLSWGMLIEAQCGPLWSIHFLTGSRVGERKRDFALRSVVALRRSDRTTGGMCPLCLSVITGRVCCMWQACGRGEWGFILIGVGDLPKKRDNMSHVSLLLDIKLDLCWINFIRVGWVGALDQRMFLARHMLQLSALHSVNVCAYG